MQAVYIPDRQRYDLITESSGQVQKCLAKLLSYIFTDQYIFIDESFRHLLENNPRGYVHSQDLSKIPIINNFFKQVPINNNNSDMKMYYIRGAVTEQCPQLYFNMGRVRRKVLFNIKKFNKMKPICIQRIQQLLTIQDIRDYFGQHVYSLNSVIDKYQDFDILLYSQNYRVNLQRINEKRPPFSIMTYEQYFKQYDLTEKLRQRKIKQLSKPIEYPRKRFDEYQRMKHRENLNEQYEYFHKQKRKHHRMQDEKDRQTFQRLAKRVNPQFNSLLGQVREADRAGMMGPD